MYALESRSAGEAVSTNDLAERLGVTPGSVSAMVRKLDDLGLVEHEPYRGVRLTGEGRAVALEVLRHHRLIELFLAQELGMGWDRVHAEAEVLEHVLSEELEQLIATRLGNPTVDPHGDPIPTYEFEIEETPTRSLDELGTGAVGRFVRVSDSDPKMLRYLTGQGVTLGDRLEVIGRQPFGGPMFVRLGDVRAGARGRARESDAHRGRGGAGVTPPPGELRPALEGAVAEGASAALGEPGTLAPSALEQLLAKGSLRATLAMLGPAFVAAIAYVDPGNFATNFQGGAQFGFLLLWVVVLANAMAMLIQYLSAKLGIATDLSLPESVRAHFPRALSWVMWVQAEIVSMSTDVAEFVGAALGLNLLFGVPLLTAGLMTGVIAFAILELRVKGYRRFELAITALLGIVFLGFVYETLKIGPSASGAPRA